MCAQAWKGLRCVVVRWEEWDGRLEHWGEVELGWLGLWSVWGYAPASFSRMRARYAEAHEVLMVGPASWGRRRPGEAVLAKLLRISGEGESGARRVLLARGREELSGLPQGGWVLRAAGGDVSRSLSAMGSGGPPYLYGVGSRALLGASPWKMVTVVGSRRVDRVGAEQALEVGERLASAGYCVLSGGALGVDACAHEGALRCGGKTAAVLGVGVDRMYPRRNEGLFRRIVSEGGSVMSPYPLGTPARRHHFPRRNQLLASMSVATVVVRARPGSGSLMTAGAAWRYGRAVLAMPADVGSRAFSGCNELLSRGASLVLSAQGVLETLSEVCMKSTPVQVGLWSSWGGEREEGQRVAREGFESSSGAVDVERLAGESLSGAEGDVMGGLLSGLDCVDELSRGLGMSIEAVQGALLSLELSGSVVRGVGGRYRLV